MYPKDFLQGIFLFFGRTTRHVGSYLPDQGLSPCSLQWKRGVLTTGPPGMSLSYAFTKSFIILHFTSKSVIYVGLIFVLLVLWEHP